MSYCCWSDDCFRCDVYCYEADNRYRINVASARRDSDEPRPEKPTGMDGAVWLKYFHACLEWAERAEMKPIGLPCDGKSYSFDMPGECAEKLIELRDMGYNVPRYAIESLLEEAKEEK